MRPKLTGTSSGSVSEPAAAGTEDYNRGLPRRNRMPEKVGSDMVDPVDYQLLLKHPDRAEPEYADYTSFDGAIEVDQVLTLPEKGEWRVEEIERSSELRLPRLVCVPADA
jgi:hypothetical protein